MICGFFLSLHIGASRSPLKWRDKNQNLFFLGSVSGGVGPGERYKILYILKGSLFVIALLPVYGMLATQIKTGRFMIWYAELSIKHSFLKSLPASSALDKQRPYKCYVFLIRIVRKGNDMLDLSHIAERPNLYISVLWLSICIQVFK